jgi:ribonuclease VapC
VIVVDTSALMAIIQGEPEALACREATEEHAEILIAAPSLTESLIVAAGRRLHGEMARLIDDLILTVVPLSEERAYAAVCEYLRWGKGFHRAKLNLGDCFIDTVRLHGSYERYRRKNLRNSADLSNGVIWRLCAQL